MGQPCNRWVTRRVFEPAEEMPRIQSFHPHKRAYSCLRNSCATNVCETPAFVRWANNSLSWCDLNKEASNRVRKGCVCWVNVDVVAFSWVLELSWFAAESDACSTHAQADCSFWMDLGFSLPDKSNDTYPQHHEKVSILGGSYTLKEEYFMGFFRISYTNWSFA
jgi:hypothetical protein